ncbi:hypothetical protein Scep_014294 [Stephania cephalantha]|uniref:Aminotransferase-like plant mobile domain-containing protein n=1 Tax=Stephania cephalantha TaxID=152367 RepID=A0AAP0J2U9_9MAGN
MLKSSGSLPEYCTDGHGSWLSTCPLIYFHIVEWHRPERVMRQFEMIQVVAPNCAYDTRLHRIELRGRNQENWVTFHASFIQMWENRGHNIVTAAQDEEHDHQDYTTWYCSVTRRFIGHDGALRDYSCNLVHRLRRVFIEDGYEQGLVALDEGIRILDEDERQRSTLWNDGIDVEQDINEENEEEDEEEDHGESNREVRRRRTRTETVGKAPNVLVHHVHLVRLRLLQRVADVLLQYIHLVRERVEQRLLARVANAHPHQVILLMGTFLHRPQCNQNLKCLYQGRRS